MLCKHEVVGSIPSCSTVLSDGAMGSPEPSASFDIRHRPRRLAHRPPLAGVLFDIVKSERVRPEGLAARPARACRRGPIRRADAAPSPLPLL